jgi:hypothetical protein
MTNRLGTRRLPGAVLLLALPPVLTSAAGGEVASLVERIRAVGGEGAGNAEAARAWREMVRLGPGALPEILAGLDGADPVAANWLRAAVDAIAERGLRSGHQLPAERLEAFVRQTRHSGPARRLAYEWLARVDPSAPGRLLPGMLHDPSTELRHDAVDLVLRQARERLAEGDRPATTAAYRRALSGARDRDQVDVIARRLKDLGVEVDLAAHFGFVRQWMLLGPFDNRGGAGFNTAFVPEKGVDLARTYEGQDGAKLRWVEHTTTDPYGVVDLNMALGKHPGVAAYALAVVHSPRETPVEIRAGSENAVKIFLNGRLIFSREEYHHGMRMDQHVGRGTLRAGRNEILVKVCQNEQPEAWAQVWSFQLRVCEPDGGKVPLTDPAKRATAGRGP